MKATRYVTQSKECDRYRLFSVPLTFSQEEASALLHSADRTMSAVTRALASLHMTGGQNGVE